MECLCGYVGPSSVLASSSAPLRSHAQSLQLALCLLTSEPLPDYLLQHVQDEKLEEHDFEFIFYNLMSRVCTLRALHKHTGFVSASALSSALDTLQRFRDWDPEWPIWILPPSHRTRRRGTGRPPNIQVAAAEESHRFIWVAMSWLLINTAQILLYEILIVYHRAQQALEPTQETDEALRAASTAQVALSQDLADAVDYYLSNFETSTASTRSIGAHMLMMPLSILLGVSTTSGGTYLWIARTASRITDVFALKQGKMVADFLMMGIKAQTFALSPTEEPMANMGTVVGSVGEEETEGDWSGKGDGSGALMTPPKSPAEEMHLLIN